MKKLKIVTDKKVMDIIEGKASYHFSLLKFGIYKRMVLNGKIKRLGPFLTGNN